MAGNSLCLQRDFLSMGSKCKLLALIWKSAEWLRKVRECLWSPRCYRWRAGYPVLPQHPQASTSPPSPSSSSPPFHSLASSRGQTVPLTSYAHVLMGPRGPTGSDPVFFLCPCYLLFSSCTGFFAVFVPDTFPPQDLGTGCTF